MWVRSPHSRLLPPALHGSPRDAICLPPSNLRYLGQVGLGSSFARHRRMQDTETRPKRFKRKAMEAALRTLQVDFPRVQTSRPLRNGHQRTGILWPLAMGAGCLNASANSIPRFPGKGLSVGSQDGTIGIQTCTSAHSFRASIPFDVTSWEPSQGGAAEVPDNVALQAVEDAILD